MKNLLITIAIVLLGAKAMGQQKIMDDCATKPSAFIIPDMQLANKNQALFTTPYMLRVFVHITANDDGSFQAITNMAALYSYLEATRSFYQAHNICFLLMGINVIRSTQINNMIVDDATDYATLTGQLVPGCVNVFFHNTLGNKGGGNYNGNAYDIPNWYCSVLGSLVFSTNNSTLAHELGMLLDCITLLRRTITPMKLYHGRALKATVP